MSQFVFANNVNTTLAAGINSTATTITLTSSAHLPTLAAGEIFALTLNDAATQSVFEIVYVTAISGASLTVIRGQENTAAQSWLTNDYAYASNTAGILGSFIQSGSEPGNGFVALSPPSQQTGNIYVSGVINLGASFITTPGDGGFGRSVSTGAIFLGGTSSNAQIDYGVTSSGIVTVNKPITSTGAIQGTPTGQTVSAPVAPCYTASGAAQPGSIREVLGTFTTALNNPAQGQGMTLLGTAYINLPPSLTFTGVETFSTSASFNAYTFSGSAPNPMSIICSSIVPSIITIQVFGSTASNTIGVTISGTFTARGY